MSQRTYEPLLGDLLIQQARQRFLSGGGPVEDLEAEIEVALHHPRADRPLSETLNDPDRPLGEP